MKTFGFWHATLLGLVLALIGAAALSALPPRFGGAEGTVLVTGTLVLAYLIALLAGSPARSGRLVARAAPGLDVAHAPAPPGELRFSVADISAARRELGYAPTRSLEANLDAVIADIKERQRR